MKREKHKYLKKRILIEVGIMTVLLALLGAGVSFFVDFTKGKLTAREKLESSIRGTESQINSLRTQIGRSDEANTIYLATVERRRGNNVFAFSRAEAAEKIEEMLKKYRLSYNSSKVGPLVAFSNRAFDGLNMDVETLDIELELQAITDQHVFSFLDDLYFSFPGFIRVTDLQIERTRDITSNVLFQVYNGGEPNLVKANIRMNWIVINPQKDEAKEGSG